MNVDLPTPGAPEMPIRIAPPVAGSSSAISALRQRVVLGRAWIRSA